MAETAAAPAQRTTIGTRIRNLRVARGLTQTELAGDRFSKQYVSEIERGATRPTAQTLAWLAERLGVERHYLESGLTSKEYERAEAMVARGEAAVDAHEYREAIDTLSGSSDAPLAAPELELRALRAEAWARMYLGDLDVALGGLQRAREIVATASFTDIDRADVLLRLACCRCTLSSTATALARLHEAVGMAARSGVLCARLCSQVFGRRSRC